MGKWLVGWFIELLSLSRNAFYAEAIRKKEIPNTKKKRKRQKKKVKRQKKKEKKKGFYGFLLLWFHLEIDNCGL